MRMALFLLADLDQSMAHEGNRYRIVCGVRPVRNFQALDTITQNLARFCVTSRGLHETPSE